MRAATCRDRRQRGGVLERAEALMADAVHAEHTFFSTCGSSLSVKAAMLSVAHPHQELLIGRDAHKSVVSGLVLSGIRPVWVEPRWDATRKLAHPPGPQDFEDAFAAHPDARGALVTSPTPYGSCVDLRAVAEVCHRRARPLVVDEAWGRPSALPRGAAGVGDGRGRGRLRHQHPQDGQRAGAGLRLPSEGRTDRPDRASTRADLLGTTSPSVLIWAGLDGWRRQMALQGRELLDRALGLAHRVRPRIEEIGGLHVDDRADFCGPGRADDFDPLPVVIDLTGLGVTG